MGEKEGGKEKGEELETKTGERKMEGGREGEMEGVRIIMCGLCEGCKRRYMYSNLTSILLTTYREKA